MNAFMFYAVFAGCAAFALHKKRWGWFFFACAGLVWLLLMQCILAYATHPVGN